MVLWGAALVLREEEEIRFDLVYAVAGARVRRVMFLVAAGALLALYAVPFPAVFDYVTFMKVESTAYLKIRLDWLFSIYPVFVRPEEHTTELQPLMRISYAGFS